MPDRQQLPPDTETVLHRLRSRHPYWAILRQLDGTWIAVRGKTCTVRADDPIALSDRIIAEQAQPDGKATVSAEHEPVRRPRRERER